MTRPHTISNAIADWPQAAQNSLWVCRDIICDVAGRAAIGPLQETLKWGQPSWLPKRPRIGSTLRINWSDTDPDHLTLYVNCNTSLGETMRELYPDAFRHEGNRALSFRLDQPAPTDAIDHCAFLTLTYHRNNA